MDGDITDYYGIIHNGVLQELHHQYLHVAVFLATTGCQVAILGTNSACLIIFFLAHVIPSVCVT